MLKRVNQKATQIYNEHIHRDVGANSRLSSIYIKYAVLAWHSIIHVYLLSRALENMIQGKRNASIGCHRSNNNTQACKEFTEATISHRHANIAGFYPGFLEFPRTMQKGDLRRLQHHCLDSINRDPQLCGRHCSGFRESTCVIGHHFSRTVKGTHFYQ